MSEYISQDPGLVVLLPGLSSSAFKKLEIGTFKRQNERIEGHGCVGRHRNGKILATDPVSFCVFSVILLFDAHTSVGGKPVEVCVCVCFVCVNLFLCRRITLCSFCVSVSRNHRSTAGHDNNTDTHTHMQLHAPISAHARLHTRARTNGSILIPIRGHSAGVVDFLKKIFFT